MSEVKASTGDPFGVAQNKTSVVDYVLIGKAVRKIRILYILFLLKFLFLIKDAFVLTESGQLGLAKFSQTKTADQPKFYWVHETGLDCVTHWKKAAKLIVKARKKKFKATNK